MSQGVEAVSFVKLAEFGRGSKRRDGSTIGLNLAVADEPSQEGADLDVAVAGCSMSFRLSLDDPASFRPIVGRAQAKCRPGGNLEGLGMSRQLDNRFGLQVRQFVER